MEHPEWYHGHMPQSVSSNTTSILELLLRLLLGNSSVVLDLLFDIFQRLPVFKSLPGMYEVLAYTAELELCDPAGAVAVYNKTQRVRFLQNNIIAYQDTAWGDGEIFADYQCSPGIAVDRYREGHRYNVLISLHETKHRNDETTFRIKRTIHRGFTTKVEEFVTDIEHRTRHLTLRLIFPPSRQPTTVTLIEKNTRRSKSLETADRQPLPDGRVKYTWETKTPRLFEAYILRWEW